MSKVTDEQLITAIKKNAGVVAEIVKTLRREYGIEISRDAIYKRKEANANIAAAFEDAEAEILDIAENKLIKSIKKGELKAVMFYLRLKGKNRGYSERQEITGANGNAVMVNPFEGWSTEQLKRVLGEEDGPEDTLKRTHICRIPAEK